MQNILHPYYNAMDNGQLTMDNSADAHQLGDEMSFSLVSFPEKVVGRQARGTYEMVRERRPIQEDRALERVER